MALLFEFFSVVFALVAIFIAFYKWSFQYWKHKNIPYLKPSIPMGNMINPLRNNKQIGVHVKNLYSEMRAKKWRHGGIFQFSTPVYIPLDLEYVKNILTKDFHDFSDRGFYHNEKDDPLSGNLFGISGPKWRVLRTKLTPTFTSGKMKMMFQTLVDCELHLQVLIKKPYEKNEPVDIKNILACFTTDIIGSCAFGLDFNTFKEENSPFRVYGKKAFQRSGLERLGVVFAQTFPGLGRLLGMRFFRKDVEEFFMKIVRDNVEYRERGGFTRNDFFQLMIDMKNRKDGESGISFEDLAAQAFVFFIAGFETSSTTMTFALYELAQNQEIQEKLRGEIKGVLGKHGGRLTYDATQEMKYMQQVIDETLRKYPPVPFVTRKSVNDYKIPDQDIILNKGTRVIIPILGIHYDAEYYPDPEKFNPDRFSEENKNSIPQYAHIPFGEGPRICIGMRFGLMQSKVGLASLLNKYKFTVNRKTHVPIQFDPSSFVLSTAGDVWLDAHKL